MMRTMLALAAVFGAGILCARGQRQTQDLSSGWRFVRQDVPADAPTGRWAPVTLPHSWNGLDGQDGPTPGAAARPEDRGSDYYRGAGWYSRSLDVPAAWRGRRVFLYFEAVSQVAQVYLNGQLLGEHRGAFTAFCFELTPDLRFGEANEVRVRADNSLVRTVAPLSGDFNVAGGIYRPVHLLVTDSVCISPTNYASPGVYLTYHPLKGDEAEVAVRTLISNGEARRHTLALRTEIRDASGALAASVTSRATVMTDNPPKEFVQKLRLPHPHLWNAALDPYLYTVTVRLLEGHSFLGRHREGQLLDEVVQPLGLRTVAITPEGFLLNGRPYPIHGVNRHQDWENQAWALTPADDDRDVRLMLEMGVTAVRLAHYPQGESFHARADRAGLLLWNEVPFVNRVPNPAVVLENTSAVTDEFNRNLEDQMREMILQRYNHPAAMAWGLFNELRVEDSPAALPVVKRLAAVAHELDATRPTVAASDHLGLPTNFVADAMAYNVYPGWYDSSGPDSATRLTELINARFAEQKGHRIALSEYGAGASPFQHAEGVVRRPAEKGRWHPEEWQALVHERDWAQIADNPRLWGAFVWAMFDFASDGRREGDRAGINDKGLVTQDRAVRKDAFYFYQANWTREPMVHLTGRRATPRREAQTEVKVYSNCAEVELLLDGRSLGRVQPDKIGVARWSAVKLEAGENQLVAIGREQGREVRDTCTWSLAR